MISVFRNFAKSKWAVGLFALLILSFVVVGGTQTDVFRGLGTNNVIDAGNRTVNDQEYRSYVDRVSQNLAQQAGRPVSVEDMDAEGILPQVLDSRTKELGFLAWAWKAGIRPGEALIVKQVRQIPAFFNQISGQFDQTSYESTLARERVTVQEFEQSLRDEAAVSHYAAALFAGMRAPRIYGAVLAAQSMETRDGRWFVVNQAMAGQAAAPTDAQLTTFLNENADQLRVPEFRTIGVVLFTPGEGEVPAVTEAQIAERFEFRRASLSQAETRTFVTLSAPNQAAAARLAASLQSGQAPAEVARANSIEPVQYDARPLSAVTDRAVGAAVFGLAAGQVSAPIQGQLGWTVAKLISVQPGQAASLESAREAIVAELQGEAVKGQVFEKVEHYEKARQDGASLADAARRVGARIVALPPVTAEGRLPNGQQVQAPPQVLTAAFSLAKGGESDVIDAGQGQYFAVQVNDIRPAAVPSLAEVRAPLAERWIQRENARLLSTRAEALAARVRAGEDIAAVAQSAGATLTAQTGVQQNEASQTALGQGVLAGLFGQGRGQAFSAPGADGFVVGRVDAIRPAVPALAAPVAEQLRPRITQQMVQAMIETSGGAASDRVKARNDPARARAALGLAAEAAAATPAATGTPAKK